MKKNFILLFVFILNTSKISAQTPLNESFTATWSPTGAGWVVQNNSVPTGTTTWFQGSPAKFSANSGGPTDYYSVNFQSEAATPAGGGCSRQTSRRRPRPTAPRSRPRGCAGTAATAQNRPGRRSARQAARSPRPCHCTARRGPC